MAAKGSVMLVGDNVAIYRRRQIVKLLGIYADQQEVARQIGISPSTLTRFIQKQGITKFGGWR